MRKWRIKEEQRRGGARRRGVDGKAEDEVERAEERSS